jgi:mono/diheme cytochrome c family protein
MKVVARVAVLVIAGFAVLQCVRPGIPARPASAEIQAPVEVKRILDKNCYSCHSDQRRLAWFDQIVPAYWLVRHDVLTARAHLNFSTLGSKAPLAQKAALYESVNMIQLGAMPLPSFEKLHPEARVTPEELAVLEAYLNPWTSTPGQAGAVQAAPKTDAHTSVRAGTQVRISLASVPPELNGVPFDPDFENWKLISTTERGDNHTLRFILGNDIAVRAAQSGNISPWPDGARFAKIAWEQERGTDGLIHPGKFVQVELMVKDGRRYRTTAGWGWGRWRGPDLIPYGKDARFVEECTGCHMPVRRDDDVYTLPITAAQKDGNQLVNNRAASLPATLPWRPLQWSAITMFIDPGNRITATLYASESAVRSAPPGELSAYSPGAVLALVTWKQRDDPHWFGARIPDEPESVEFVQFGKNGQASEYRCFNGTALTENRPSTNTVAQRTQFISALPAAPMP